jgi:hypothetical protein
MKRKMGVKFISVKASSPQIRNTCAPNLGRTWNRIMFVTEVYLHTNGPQYYNNLSCLCYLHI